MHPEQNKDNLIAGTVQYFLGELNHHCSDPAHRRMLEAGPYPHALTAATGLAMGIALAGRYPDLAKVLVDYVGYTQAPEVIDKLHEYLIRWSTGEMCVP